VFAKRLWLFAVTCLFFVNSPANAAFIKLLFRAKEQPVTAERVIRTRFEQVYPETEIGIFRRSPGQNRAVILIHGLRIAPFRGAVIAQPHLHGWQKKNSTLVRHLAASADVFAFAYSQNVGVEEIARANDLAAGVDCVRMLGYTQIVLLGHSAGGLIAREFVEDHPLSGITKVVQVCSPNTGASSAKLESAIPRQQRDFLQSLTKASRSRVLLERAGKTIPENVAFVCVVGCGGVIGDGIVSTSSQWPRDLQAQRVRAIVLFTNHFTVMRTPRDIRRIVKLMEESDPPELGQILGGNGAEPSELPIDRQKKLR
jgi:pimeloyl-ACP methyl ester carboxylesterase